MAEPVQPQPIQPGSQQPRSNKPWLTAIGATALGLAYLFTPTKEGTIYTAYADPATHGEPWTICTGHTGGVHKGDTATQAQCQAYLEQDMAKSAETVARCIHVPLNVNQAAALYDSTFNIGPSVVCGSTLQRLANSKDYTGMCNQLNRWNRANGKVWAGLTSRRMDAVELCLAPPLNNALVYPNEVKR